MAEPTKIGITIDDAQMLAELAKIKARQEAVTAAVQKYGPEAAKAYTQAERAAERAAKGPSEWTLALKANTEAMNTQKGAINQSAEAMGRVAAVAGTLDPALGTIVATGQKLTGVLSAGVTAAQGFGTTLGTMGAVLGPLALAVGAVSLAWQSYEEDIAAAEEATKKAREGQEAMISAMGGIRSIVSSNASELDKLAVNYGRMTEAEAETNEITRRFADQLAAARAPLEKLREEQERAIDGSEEQGAALAATEAALRSADAAAASGLKAALENAEIARERAESEAELERRLKAREEAQRRASEADRDAARAAAEAAAAFQLKIDISKRHIASIDAESDATEALVRQVEGLGQTEEERIGQTVRDTDAALKAQIAANEELGLSTAELEASRVRLRQWAHDEYVKLSESEAKARQKADAEATNATLDSIQSIGDAAETIVDSVASVLDEVYSRRVDRAEDLQTDYEQALEDGNDARAKSLKQQMEAEQEGALKAFQINKGLAISSATLSSIVAVAKALEAGWPAALVTVPAAAAAGAAQVAAAAMQQPPEFDDTNQIRQAVASGTENRVNVSLKNGDLVAAAQTPGGLREQVDRMEGGRGRREIVAERMNRVMAGRTVSSDLDRVTRGIWRTA